MSTVAAAHEEIASLKKRLALVEGALERQGVILLEIQVNAAKRHTELVELITGQKVKRPKRKA